MYLATVRGFQPGKWMDLGLAVVLASSQEAEAAAGDVLPNVL
jgi:hypothetical protein